jgi:hypothetical protein
MTSLVELVARRLTVLEESDPDGETIIPERPKRWMLLTEEARSVLEIIRDPDALLDACRRAADPASGDVCWAGVSVHRAADIVDAVIGAALHAA